MVFASLFAVVAMMNVLGVQEYVPEDAVVQVDKKRCYYCLAAIHGKPGYKKLKDKLGKFKFVCHGDDCEKTLCHDHLTFYCAPCFRKLTEK